MNKKNIYDKTWVIAKVSAGVKREGQSDVRQRLSKCVGMVELEVLTVVLPTNVQDRKKWHLQSQKK